MLLLIFYFLQTESRNVIFFNFLQTESRNVIFFTFCKPNQEMLIFYFLQTESRNVNFFTFCKPNQQEMLIFYFLQTESRNDNCLLTQTCLPQVVIMFSYRNVMCTISIFWCTKQICFPTFISIKRFSFCRYFSVG